MIGAKKAKHELGDKDNKKIHYLKQQGLHNPHRVKSLIKDAINKLDLDLTDLVVFTEAASKYYVVTPIIAAMAGAKVHAITRDSKYGTAKDIEKYTYQFAEFCDVIDKINVVFDKTKESISQANIVTNLGWVRPIDKWMISLMKKTAVVPLMYETWEYRERDIDILYCMKQGIPVLGTNESDSPLQIFDYCGTLAVKLCFDAGLEIKNNKIAIYSNDKFGPVARNALINNGAEVHLFSAQEEINADFISIIDALITMSMIDPENIFLWPIIRKSLLKNKSMIVIQYIGLGDLTSLKELNIKYFPPHMVEKHRMAHTLSYLGPQPLILLNTAGLKVGEVMARARLSGKSIEDTKRTALRESLAQDFNAK